jgi:small-conductance mechanosensitive channel
LPKETRGARAFIAGKYLVWLTLRVSILAFLFVLLESSYRAGLFAFLGNPEVQSVFYSILQKILFSLLAWLFLAISKKIIIPAVIVTISPVVGKVVRDPNSRLKTFRSTKQYLTYIIYFAVIVAFILIWAYSFIGAWIAGFLGTGLIVALTFVLGLFTSSVLGNVLAYTVLNGSQEFKTGDRVQIGESYGDIVEVGIFFTRIKTIKDEIISIPNLTVMGKELKNFSALKEVLIYVSVSLGYDVDKDKAKRILIESAEKTSGIVTTNKKSTDFLRDLESAEKTSGNVAADRKPFVLLRDLGNYAITYEINAYTNRPNSLVNIKSELIDNILSEFKKSNIEILSPFHVATRQHLSPTGVGP